MKTVLTAALVAAALALGPMRAVIDGAARLKHVVSVYFDEKSSGLHLPEGIACDGKGQFLVGDTGNDRLVRFTLQDGIVRGGSEIRVPELSAPTRVQLGSKGDIFALDGRQRRIVHLSADGTFNQVVSLDGVPPPATVVPKGFAVDAADNLHVLDVFAGRVLVLGADGAFQRAIPLPEGTGFAGDVAVDELGNVLVLDSIKRRILSAGRDATSFTQLGGDLTGPLVTLPVSLAASRGTIFVVEGSGSAITAFGQDGAFVARQLTMGWQEGSLNHPSQMCINEKDEVFVADRDNSRIQVFALGR